MRATDHWYIKILKKKEKCELEMRKQNKEETEALKQAEGDEAGQFLAGESARTKISSKESTWTASWPEPR